MPRFPFAFQPSLTGASSATTNQRMDYRLGPSFASSNEGIILSTSSSSSSFATAHSLFDHVVVALRNVHTVGETILIATLTIAFLQALLALIQYRTNPSGQLVVPPGRTYGIEYPHRGSRDTRRELFEPRRQSGASRRINLWMKGLRKIKRKNPTVDIIYNELGEPIRNKGDNKFSDVPSMYTRIIQQINRFLLLLLPWMYSGLKFIVQRNTQAIHIIIIMTIVRFVDFPQKISNIAKRSKVPTSVSHRVSVAHDPIQVPPMTRTEPYKKDRQYQDGRSRSSNKNPRGGKNLVVLGDSLAVGIGSVDVFDKEKTNNDPFCRIENMSSSNQVVHGPGPVFPRVLAQTLADDLNTPIAWRSAGVDGGDTKRIRKFCLGVIREEVEQGRSPDIVVLVCGINDLKRFVSDPIRSPSPAKFRARLTQFIMDIHELAPSATIILPSLPVQMIYKFSPLNIFPLSLFFDAVVGIWDSQKLRVQNQFPKSMVQYIGITPSEFFKLYKQDIAKMRKEMSSKIRKKYSMSEKEEPPKGGDEARLSLLAGDGVHPNARCYSYWASSLGDRIASNIASGTRRKR